MRTQESEEKNLNKWFIMPNILITGQPRVGKTSLINKAVELLNKKVVGFVTNEVRINNKRIGFDIQSYSGLILPLASKDNFQSKYKVASYGVFVENVDRIVNQIEEDLQSINYNLIILDEIGKMELLSSKFKKLVLNCLDKRCVLGTIMLSDNDFTSRIKNRTDTVVFKLTEANRNQAINEISKLMR